MKRWLLAAALAWMMPSPTSGGPHQESKPGPPAAPPEERRLELRIRPAYAPAPGAIRATAFVSRHADNRGVTIGAECPIYRRRSTIQLDGEEAARSHTITFESLPACSYEISARLHRRDGDDLVEVLAAEITR